MFINTLNLNKLANSDTYINICIWLSADTCLIVVNFILYWTKVCVYKIFYVVTACIIYFCVFKLFFLKLTLSRDKSEGN